MGSMLIGDSAEEGMATEIQVTPSPPESKTRRRCVQSKLRWGSSPTPEGNLAKKASPEVAGLEESDDTSDEEDFRKKKRRYGKSKPRVSKKSSITSKELQSLNTGKKNSSISVGNFEGNNNCQKMKNNRSSFNTPKNASPAADFEVKGSYFEQQQTKASLGDMDDQCIHKKQPVCDLRLEAKLAAKENMRLSTGKNMHPFFTSKAKKLFVSQDAHKVENRNGFDLDCVPFHVLDEKVDYISLDWSNWDIRERTLLESTGLSSLGSTSSSFEDLIEPLHVNSVCLEESHPDHSSTVNEKFVTSATVSYLISDKREKNKLFSDMEFHLDNDSCLSSKCGSISNPGGKNVIALVTERLLSYYQRGSHGPECSLWTDKYRPENADEVCGNHDSVKHLAEWLNSWHEKFSKKSEGPKSAGHCAIEDDDDTPYEYEFDMEEADGSNLKNVLLITGPVGSGKSAAVYACAKEQGFEVIEVNTSDWRNNLCLKQKFGEALDSLGLDRWSVGKFPGQGIMPNGEMLPSKTDNEECKQLKDFEDNEQGEASIPNSCDVAEKPTLKSQVVDKSLILFEDVDVTFDADHGFHSAITRLAEVSKRPIVLTSTSKNPALPPYLDRLKIDFQPPSIEDLLLHCRMVCVSEKAQVSAYLLKHLIKSCLGDMRKTLILLQFWCQGNNHHFVRTKQCAYNPLSFDIDAAHMVMPRVISWGSHCELSEKVMEEINKTILMMEESSLDFQLAKMVDSSNLGKINNTSNRKKKAKLKMNNSSLDVTKFTAADQNLEDLCDGSDSPIDFFQRRRDRPRVILSSQSDDDPNADEPAPTPTTLGYADNHELPETIRVSISQPQEVASLHTFENHELPDNLYFYDNCERHDPDGSLSISIAAASHTFDIFNLHDVSCVPESSFIPGTEFSKEESFVSAAVSSDNRMSNFSEFIQSIHMSQGEESKSLIGGTAYANLCSGNNFSSMHDELDTESVHGNEELGDKYNGVEVSQVTGFQFMDECSQANFNLSWVPGNCSKYSHVLSVHDTWQRLRSQHEDLKSYLTSNQKETMLITELASKLTNILSESDVMLNACNPLATDMLEPSSTPSVEPDDFSWYDKQLQIVSTYAQHGVCFYTSMCTDNGANLGLTKRVALAQEMLASSTTSIDLGKKLTHGISMTENIHNESTDIRNPKYDSLMERKLKCGLLDAILSMVPPRVSMTLRGPGFSDYLSFTSHICKLESSRISSDLTEGSRRRSRASRHYMSSGSLSLSHENVELLTQSRCFNSKVP